MASSSSEVTDEFPPFIRVYADGRVERLMGTEIVPPSIDPQTGVQSKDVVISPETGVSARLYMPKTANPDAKLPLLIYFHGGAFFVQTAFSPTYQPYLNSLAAEANVVLLSVDYRRAPEHPLPIAYEDSWISLKWVSSHSAGGSGHEVWLKDYADFDRVFFAGDSSGANIAHNMGMRVGSEKLDGVKLEGIVLMHPYFWGKDPVGAETRDINRRKLTEKYWLFACPSSSGSDDILINPALDPGLFSLGCTRVLVCVAEMDFYRHRGWHYYEALNKSGWGGTVEIMETEGEGHVFHLDNPYSKKALDMLKKVVSFIK